MSYIFQGRYIVPDLCGLYDMYDLAHDAGWELYSAHGRGHVAWIRICAYYRSCTEPQNGRIWSTLGDLSDLPDISDLWMICT